MPFLRLHPKRLLDLVHSVPVGLTDYVLQGFPKKNEVDEARRPEYDREKSELLYRMGLFALGEWSGRTEGKYRGEKLLENSAEMGHVGAIFRWGSILEKGWRMGHAEGLYRKLAEQGNADAMVSLARVLWERAKDWLRDTGDDKKRAGRRAMNERTEWLKKAANEHGDPEACWILSRLHRKGKHMAARDRNEAARLAAVAARSGHEVAMADLAGYHAKGPFGEVARDYAAAVAIYSRCARDIRGCDLADRKIPRKMGRLYAAGGNGIERDAEKAAEMFERAVGMGDVKAMFHLGMLLRGDGGSGSGGEGDIPDAGADARARVGAGVERGGREDPSTPRDLGRALVLLDTAANNHKHAEAAYQAAGMYARGEGIPEPDAATAERLYQLAAKEDHPGAMWELAERLRPHAVWSASVASFFPADPDADLDTERGSWCVRAQGARTWYKHAAKFGHVGACEAMGDIKRRGLLNARRSAYVAKYFYRQAWERGESATARARLGRMHERGSHEGRFNAPKAERCYRDAVGKGCDTGRIYLAKMLRKSGGEEERGEARALVAAAAANGNHVARRLLAEDMESGAGTWSVPCDPDPAGALRMYELAAAQGDHRSLLKLANLHLDGGEAFGVARDPAKAFEFFERWSRDRDDAEVLYRMGRMLEKGRGVEVNTARARRLYWSAARMGLRKASRRLDDLPAAWSSPSPSSPQASPLPPPQPQSTPDPGAAAGVSDGETGLSG